MSTCIKTNCHIPAINQTFCNLHRLEYNHKMRSLRQARIANGRCQDCNAPLSQTNHSYCESHRQYHLNYDLTSKRTCRSLGLCWQCKEPAADGLTYCQRHRELNKKYNQEFKVRHANS